MGLAEHAACHLHARPFCLCTKRKALPSLTKKSLLLGWVTVSSVISFVSLSSSDLDRFTSSCRKGKHAWLGFSGDQTGHSLWEGWNFKVWCDFLDCYRVWTANSALRVSLQLLCDFKSNWREINAYVHVRTFVRTFLLNRAAQQEESRIRISHSGPALSQCVCKEPAHL